MSLCFLSLMRLAMLVGGLQAYWATQSLTTPSPPRSGEMELAVVPVPCLRVTPAPVAVDPNPRAMHTRSLPMPRELAEPPQAYAVRVLQINTDESSMQWPTQILLPGKEAHIGFEMEVNHGWMMTTRVQPSEKSQQVKLHLLVTHLTGEDTPLIYKGTLECKLGAAHLTVLRESSGKHLLPIRVQVDASKPEAAVVQQPVQAVPGPIPAERPSKASAVPLKAPTPLGPAKPPVAFAPASLPVAFAFVAAPLPKTVTLKIENGETKLDFRSPDLRTSARQLTLELPVGSIEVQAGKGHIQVQGLDFTARATKLEILGDCLKLIGEAQLHCERLGRGAEVKADTLTVRLNRGGFAELVTVPPLMPPARLWPLVRPGVGIAVPATMPACPGAICPPDCCPGGICRPQEMPNP